MPSSYLQYPAHADFALGAADFVIEGYLNCDHHKGILVASPGATDGIFLGVRDGRLIAAYGTTSAQSGLLVASTTHPALTQFHAAWVKKNGTLTIYQNGTPVGSIAWPAVNTDATCPLFLGGASSSDITIDGHTAPWVFQGFLDDFRFTKIDSRYGGSFIAPLAPHADSAGSGAAPAPGYLWRVGNPTGARIQWTGSAVEIYSPSNQLAFSSGTLINVSQIVGIGALATADSVGINQVAGAGSLATQSSVSTAQVNGLGSLATQNTVSTAQVTGLGAFATVSQINDGNVGTYIAAGAISNAYIGNFISSANFNGVINSSGNITNFGSVGWAIGKAGNAVFNDVKLRGELNGGPFTGFAWPAAGAGNGFHLGPSGLMLGNYNTVLPGGKRRYLQINSDGNFYAPGFSIVDGTLSINEINVISTLNIAQRAVTVPVYVNFPRPGGPELIANYNYFIPIDSVTINRQGSATLITWNAQLDAISGTTAYRFFVLRGDGVQIGETFDFGVSLRNSFTLVVVDESTGTGNTTYTINVALIIAQQGRLYQSFLAAEQFMR